MDFNHNDKDKRIALPKQKSELINIAIIIVKNQSAYNFQCAINYKYFHLNCNCQILSYA